MAHKIDTRAARQKLVPRREPYWHKLTRGRYIGFRRTETGGSWVARLQDETRKKHYQSLGEAVVNSIRRNGQAEGSLDFDEAVTQALSWFTHAAHVEDKHYRVRDAVADYIRHLKTNNSPKSARDTELRLKNHVPASIMDTELAKLSTVQLQRWHQSLVRLDGDAEDTRRSKDGANKLLTKLRAALNLAFRSGLAASDREWRKVRPFKGVGASRRLFLTDEQVRALLDHTHGAFRALIKAAVLTGARYGELRAARVEDFDRRHGTLRLSGKTGPRDCYLSDEGLSLFKTLAKGKAPHDFILQRDRGGPWLPGDQYHAINEAVKRAELPSETVFYALRHYHISKALLAGLPAQVIAENCGTSVAMIEKYYGKFMPKDRRAMLNRVALL